MAHFAIRTGLIAAVAAPLALSGAWGPAPAHADNQRLNSGVIANVFTIQHQAGCTNNVTADPKLRLAAEWHTNDLLADRSLDDHAGSDGSTPQSRAEAAGFRGRVAETVAINPALAINGIEILNQWYYDPVDFAILSDCANTAIGVWSANSFDRSVVVAVLGQPANT
ncbi:CAP domain-containing protein [Mycolicibacterium septicum]|uniref:CAP domain-containing protein n=1 Tax=Mycolicibacterium septicum TaxID=98668 RepID=UPI0004087EAA|nr:CAP domain-containing protein [Mycolicibacterium septicum]